VTDGSLLETLNILLIVLTEVALVSQNPRLFYFWAVTRHITISAVYADKLKGEKST
jgi:hypothetical protein